MEHINMTRYVNKVQSDVMLNRMQNNRSIACGFKKISKEVVSEFWKSLTEELSTAGPPIKNVTEWKKVWTDQKRYVRSKAAANMKNQRATGGGPNQTKYLTDSEQCIFDLIGMKESVEGLENTQPQTPPSHHDETMLSETPCCSKQVTPPPQDPILNEEPYGKKPYSLKRKRMEDQQKLSTADLIAKEVATQEKLYSKICEMGAGMKRLYRALEKTNEQKSKELKMLKKHHEMIEQLRLKEVESKIEKNNKLIYIEEMKLKILEKNNSNY